MVIGSKSERLSLSDAPNDNIRSLTTDLFRRQYSIIVGSLLRSFGGARLGLAEDAAQHAWTKAITAWSKHGIPNKPGAWLQRCARNYAIDVLRRDDRFQTLIASQCDLAPDPSSDSPINYDQELADTTVRLLFLCAHPSVSNVGRIALILKIAGGFSIEEIARAFFASPQTIYQRIHRAKNQLKKVPDPFEMPIPKDLPNRVDVVLDALYLMFNKGYSPSDTDSIFQFDIINETLRLTSVVANHPTTGLPHAQALLAIMLFHCSRLRTRIDTEGNLVPITRQNRQMWDCSYIHRGMDALRRAGTGEELSEYHLLAGIAACHATARSESDTNWHRILQLYDQLQHLNSGFVIATNRAVAFARVHGASAALKELNTLKDSRAQNNYLVLATHADLLREMGNDDQAAEMFEKAAKFAPSAIEKRYCLHMSTTCKTRNLF